ncbi:hypothetical protein KY284_012330 [Solanum tuberosum]|nr:hypothetical protein KY284_012330 [Solanum tuberosum]
MHNFRFQTSSKEGVTSSVHVTGTTLGNGEEQYDIQDLLSFKQVKNKSLIPATSLDQFQKQQGIVIGDEGKQINYTISDVEYMPAPSIHEHNKGLDALEDQEEIDKDECVVDEEVDIYCRISKQKQVRGKTTCKNIHARNLEEREEVTFDKGQAVGPTDKIVLELTNVIRTIARNPRFINLMYTSWHAMPKDIKKRMWKYINYKKRSGMTGLRDAWRRHKQKIKERCFDKNSIVEDILAKRPDDIPKAQFCQLIEYWKHPIVQAISEVNSKNRKQQQWRHRMGPINFARLRVALQATKENNEEPSQHEMFITTHTKTGKEIHADTQVAITELQNRQNSGETTDDALGQRLERSSLADLGVVGSNLVSHVDASSAQAVRGQNIPHYSGSTHDSVLQKLFLLAVGLILHNKIIIVIMSRNSRVKCRTS